MILNGIIKQFSETAICFEYSRPTEDILREISNHQKVVVLEAKGQLVLDQSYFRAEHAGTSAITYTRLAVAKRLEQALEMLSPYFGILVFDAYRSIEAQRALFEFMASQIKKQNPSWADEQVRLEARKYMVHPDEKSRFQIPPHNSGGAIDLALHINGQMIDFGTEFDNSTQVSSTLFFEREYDPQFGFGSEQWNQIRIHRRILFYTMRHLGFTNYPDEWWHYDLADCMWSQELGIPWIFGSMEPEVSSHERNV
jgi:D-alanyl-D-alanine dipeptidase